MRILADENIEDAVVEWMRAGGHDVKKVGASLPSVKDRQVLAIAVAENRVLITYDRDFGDLVFRQRSMSTGIVLLRFSASKIAGRIVLLEQHWPDIESSSTGTFMVVSDDRVRVRRLDFKTRLDDALFDDDDALPG
jgi:predicted nuclease of predicted toxin-antitoxin system